MTTLTPKETALAYALATEARDIVVRKAMLSKYGQGMDAMKNIQRQAQHDIDALKIKLLNATLDDVQPKVHVEVVSITTTQTSRKPNR